MSKNENKLVPKLRFPYFKNEGEWEIGKVDSLFGLQDGYPFSSSDFSGTHHESIQVIRITDINNQNKNEEKVYVSKTKIQDLDIEKYRVQKDDLLLSLTGAAGFNFFIWNTNYGYINQRTMKLFPKKIENKALSILLEPLIHYKINEIGTGQNNNLSKDALKEIDFPFPKPNEQQKIAACLSSLDDIITAERQKLELLKEHKKGLLQNLFPQEGETIPKLRFKEFEDSGEWEEKTLGSIADFINGRAYKQEELLSEGKYRVLRVGNFFTNNEWYYSNLELDEDKYCENGNLLYAWSASFGPRIWIGEKVIYHYHIWKVKNHSGIKRRFLFYILDFETLRIKSQSANGFALLHITKGTIESWECHIPKSEKEQQKIADTLISIDELINAHSQKIEAFTLHKKGLLQGLFPVVNEVN